MGISKEEAIKELQNRETVFVAYSQATKLPYVKCDEETYNDQAWIFSTEEGIKEFGKKMLEEKVLLMGMKFTKKDYPRLYGTFYAIGVNTVVWVDGEDKIEIDLTDIAKQADMSKIEPAKRPLLNPTLELSGIYFMQELRRPVEKDQHGNLRELEEELIVNLKKSEYLVAMNVDPEDPKKINIPYLKNKKEEILQPVFTDVMELEKFTKGQKLRIAKVPFAKLPELLIDKAMAYAVNPLGFNLVLNREQLKGSVQRAVKEIRSRLLYQIAYIESALDDPEHYDLTGYPQELRVIVDKETKEIQDLLKTADDGRMIQEGIKTVILGKPNAGKSSLLNFLVGEDRAIVTEIEGTTRDILEEYISLNGITLRVIDTAGIRETEDVVEKIGVGKAKQMAEDADLILYVVDSSRSLDENDEEIIELLSGRKSIVIYNKTDLEPVVDMEKIKQRTGSPVIPVSVVEETGIRKLEDEIKNMFFQGELSFNDEVYITNARHKAALEEAKESLELVKNSIDMGMAEDFFSIDLMNAYESLGRIVGESVGEDLVNEIFSKFCTGK